MYQKNHTFLIDIFAEVYKQNPQAVLFLIGEGELEEKIRKQIHNLNIQDAVIFTGSIPNVNEFYQAMDVFLLPSLYEGLPVVGIEAQASGIPCIFSDTVTEEVGITDMAEFVPLNASTTVWTKEILKYAKGYERKNMAAEIVHTGYSIHTEAKKMQDRYLKMIEPAGK